jgi:ribosomal-protein-alanine N-acetyltransferase
MARDIPWRGVSSLAALAADVRDAEFYVAIDARRREFFIQRYENKAAASPIEIVQKEELVELKAPLHIAHPSPLAIAQLAISSEPINEPIYIRKPDAYPAPKGVKFRPWTQLDLITIYGIECESYPDDPWSLDQFKEEYAGAGRQYLVAEIDGAIVGYAGVMVMGDVTDILTLTVSSSHRRKGIAREMLKRMIDWSRNQKVDAVMLEMRVGNLEAEPLYRANGFRKISHRADYYGPGVDADVYRKELKK